MIVEERLQGRPVLYIVVPCYNEEKVLPVTAPMFADKIDQLTKMDLISGDSRVLFVNDGSADRTWEIINDLSVKNPVFAGVSLSRNRGHQNALLAGLMEVRDRCDISISIDCDGQDDIDAMDEMVRQYLDGSEIVYGVRKDRQTDTFFKRTTAELFYRFLRIMGAEVVFNHADYRLVSSRVLRAFSDFKEVNIYLRGMFPLVGFRSTCVYYSRNERIAGESHYPLRKMLALAMEGVTSLSVKPIRLITNAGLFVSFLSFLLIIWTFVSFFLHRTVPGWSSIMIASLMIGGIQLISLGIIGEYIGKIYMETKSRPRFVLSEKTDNLMNKNNDEEDAC